MDRLHHDLKLHCKPVIEHHFSVFFARTFELLQFSRNKLPLERTNPRLLKFCLFPVFFFFFFFLVNSRISVEIIDN